MTQYTSKKISFCKNSFSFNFIQSSKIALHYIMFRVPECPFESICLRGYPRTYSESIMRIFLVVTLQHHETFCFFNNSILLDELIGWDDQWKGFKGFNWRCVSLMRTFQEDKLKHHLIWMMGTSMYHLHCSEVRSQVSRWPGSRTVCLFQTERVPVTSFEAPNPKRWRKTKRLFLLQKNTQVGNPWDVNLRDYQDVIIHLL